MSTTAVAASEVMDRVANLLNDPAKTDYTYIVQIPYLNMAIEEFSDLLAESNSPFTNLTNQNWSATPIIIPVGISFLVAPEDIIPGNPKYPPDLIEIQEIGERLQGDTGRFTRLPRKEFGEILPVTNSLGFWYWERGVIRFNPNGANTPIEVQLKYIYQGIPYVQNPADIITMIGSRGFLAYKTAALCAMFIGENETRAQVLEDQASKAVDRAINISNKGKQEIPTRHRPFRASYKSRGAW